MKKVFQFVFAVLIFGWASMCFAQPPVAVCPSGSVSVSTLQGFKNNPPTIQQNACIDTSTGLLSFPSLFSEQSSMTNGFINAASFPSISAAISFALGTGLPGAIWIPCGTYFDNIVIQGYGLGFGITLWGEDKSCVIIKPANATQPVISINANGVTAIDGTMLKNLFIQCPTATACSDAILITGKQTVTQVNDHIVIEDVLLGNLYVVNTAGTSGFNNCINATGRTIYSNFNRVTCWGSRGNGLNVSLVGGAVGPFDLVQIDNSVFDGAFNYSVNINCNGAVSQCLGVIFNGTEMANSGNNVNLTPCAATLIQAVWTVSFYSDHWESNCLNNVADANAAHLRITGAGGGNGMQVNLHDSSMLSGGTGPKFGYFNDAVSSSSKIDGIRFIGNAVTANVHFANTNMNSFNIVDNLSGSGKLDIVADASGDTHVAAPAMGVGAKTVINNAACPLAAGVFDLVNSCVAANLPSCDLGVVGGPVTVNNILNGSLNQTCRVCSDAGVITMTNAAGGNGQFLFRDAQNRLLQTNQCVNLRRLIASDTWQEVAVGALIIGSGTSTSNGTLIGAGATQAQPAITITGATTSDVASCNLNNAPPATWQTGIVLSWNVTANTVTPELTNPTAAGITPAAQVVRCSIFR